MERGLMHNNRDVEPWPSRVPPGVPGAGWVVAIFFAFAVITLTQWWWQEGHGAIASPTAAHHTNGAGNGVSQ